MMVFITTTIIKSRQDMEDLTRAKRKLLENKGEEDIKEEIKKESTKKIEKEEVKKDEVKKDEGAVEEE
ncbi:MAG TPA: hypothetical protein ENH17_00285 [Nitrospirae bacterium]|nr:hypothetical protein [Nitrospirota bacterium]